jgi:hypothetical protein
VADWDGLCARVAAMTGDRATCGPAVRLMMQIEVRAHARAPKI